MILKSIGSLAVAVVIAGAVPASAVAGGNGCNWSNCSNPNNKSISVDINVDVDLPNNFAAHFEDADFEAAGDASVPSARLSADATTAGVAARGGETSGSASAGGSISSSDGSGGNVSISGGASTSGSAGPAP